jgi:hypothetical protein
VKQVLSECRFEMEGGGDEAKSQQKENVERSRGRGGIGREIAKGAEPEAPFWHSVLVRMALAFSPQMRHKDRKQTGFYLGCIERLALKVVVLPEQMGPDLVSYHTLPKFADRRQADSPALSDGAPVI